MQEKQYVMALDAGTTSNRAIIFDNESHIVSVSQKEFTQYFPKPAGSNTMPMKFSTAWSKSCAKPWHRPI